MTEIKTTISTTITVDFDADNFGLDEATNKINSIKKELADIIRLAISQSEIQKHNSIRIDIQ